MVVRPARRLFTIEEYEQMVDAGVLGEDDRLELIEGEILEMAPIGPPHSGTVNRLTQLLTSRLGDRAVIAVQNPVRLWPRSEPQPDLAVLQPREDFYGRAHPEPSDVLVLVEVADSSIRFDRDEKIPLYARHGITEVWLVDLNAGVIEVARDLGPGGYAVRLVLHRGETLTLNAFPEITFEVSDILG